MKKMFWALGVTLKDDVSDVKAFLTLRSVFPEALVNDPKVVGGIEKAYSELLVSRLA